MDKIGPGRYKVGERTTVQDNSSQGFAADLADFFGGMVRGGLGNVASVPGEAMRAAHDAGQAGLPAPVRWSYEQAQAHAPLGLPMTYDQLQAATGAPNTDASHAGQVLGMINPFLPEGALVGQTGANAARIGRELGALHAEMFPLSAMGGRSHIVAGGGAAHPPPGLNDMRREILARFQANEPTLSPAEAQLGYGAWRGPDNMARWEIDDSTAKLLMPYAQMQTGMKVPDVLDHPELFRQYPQLANTTIDTNALGGTLGSFNRHTKTIKLGPQTDDSVFSTLLHELQHNVQDIEGFVNGGSPAQFPNMSPGAAYEAYLRIAGEAEARQVQARRAMDPVTRAVSPFYQSPPLDVPYRQLTLDSVYPMPLEPPGVSGIEVGGPGNVSWPNVKPTPRKAVK